MGGDGRSAFPETVEDHLAMYSAELIPLVVSLEHWGWNIYGWEKVTEWRA